MRWTSTDEETINGIERARHGSTVITIQINTNMSAIVGSC